MGIHIDEWIVRNGERYYLVTCDEILPPHHARCGQVCGNRRYLRKCAGEKAECCFQCSQRRKGKLGYKAALETVRRKGYETLPQAFLDKHPSKSEIVAANYLDRNGFEYERNVRLPNVNRHWLIDFCVASKVYIEIDGIWTHSKRKDIDSEKDRVALEHGITLHRIPVPSGRLSKTDIETLESRLDAIIRG